LIFILLAPSLHGLSDADFAGCRVESVDAKSAPYVKHTASQTS
jgi:hypothetical protein